jgi:hypothetical protein
LHAAASAQETRQALDLLLLHHRLHLQLCASPFLLSWLAFLLLRLRHRLLLQRLLALPAAAGACCCRQSACSMAGELLLLLPRLRLLLLQLLLGRTVCNAGHTAQHRQAQHGGMLLRPRSTIAGSTIAGNPCAVCTVPASTPTAGKLHAW